MKLTLRNVQEVGGLKATTELELQLDDWDATASAEKVDVLMMRVSQLFNDVVSASDKEHGDEK